MMDTRKINFDSDGAKIQMSSDYIDHNVWQLTEIDFNTINSTERFFGLKTNYTTSDASFELTLKRRPLYFMINNIFPTLILNLVVLFLFTLPFAQQMGSSMLFYYIMIYEIIIN